MNEIKSLLEEHDRLRADLAALAGELAWPEFGPRIRNFVPAYQRHDESEKTVFKKWIERDGSSKLLSSLRDYQDLHAGARELLKELEGVLRSSESVFSIQRAFWNFRLMALSHFEYEEQWIFPFAHKSGQKSSRAAKAGGTGRKSGMRNEALALA